jgi:hypothetical protein
MHDQVLRACAPSDYIIHALVPIIMDMLEEDPNERPTAKKLRTKCHQALDRATKLSVTGGNTFPIAFRMQAEMTAQLQTPQEQEHPCPTDYHGLGIVGSSQTPFQQPASPVAPNCGIRNSPNSIRHSRSQYNGNNSIDIIIDERSRLCRSPDFESLSLRTGIGPDHRQALPHVTWSTANLSSPEYPDSATRIPYDDSQIHSTRESSLHGNHQPSYNEVSVAGGTEVLSSPQSGSEMYEKQRGAETETGSHATIDMVDDLIQKRKNKVPTNSIFEELRSLPSLQKRDQVRILNAFNNVFLTSLRYSLLTTRPPCENTGRKFRKHSRFWLIS